MQTEWLQHTSVITWDDISHKIVATGRLPADILRSPLEKMEQAFPNGLAKMAINSMVGLWALDGVFA